MKESFLYRSAEKILTNESERVDEISIILPSKRASTYLQKALSAQIKEAFISPNIQTINEWIDHHTPNRIITQTEQVFLLYQVHRQIEGSSAEEFGSFLKWGKIILSDFDEIDRNLIPPKQIFRDLKSIDEIENWSFGEDELSPAQENYSRLWSKLPIYYEQFNELLDQHKYTYQGRAYREFLENMKTLNETVQHYYFIGFNALSKSELGIVKFLLKQSKAELFFDYDQFYISNPKHEAGLFYRQLKKELTYPIQLSDKMRQDQKSFEIIETSSQIAQVHTAASILGDLVKNGNKLDKTALVLADESLLPALLRSLPPELETANISMGYPIRFSHLQGLIDLLFEIQFNYSRFKNDKLYHKSILKLVHHPYFKDLYFTESRLLEFQESLLSKNRIFIERKWFFSFFPRLKQFQLILESWENNLSVAFEAFHQLAMVIHAEMRKNEAKYTIDLELIYHFHKGLKRFEEMNNRYDFDYNLKSFKQLFYQFWQSESLSFLGNPTDGLQIIGVLESRALDFEQLIVLGMNEGNLPKTKGDTSLIPYDLKRVHQLPTSDEREAIFAHHFYRLLHQAKQLWFSYNSSAENLTSGEKSRYLIQLEHELNPTHHSLKHSTFSFREKTAKIELASYPVNPATMVKLDNYFKSGLSPSAFNKLIRCPLDFFYTYVLGLREAEKVEESVEASTFGTKIHDVLEDIFRRNFLEQNKQLTVEILKKERKQIARLLKEQYLKNFSASDIQYGQNKLRFDVSVKYLEEFIDKQITEIKTNEPIEIVQLEENLLAEYEWEMNGVKKRICLSGKADRIDRIGNHFRIIDYKSGKCEEKNLSLSKTIFQSEGMSAFLNHKDKGYARQLLMYALMFRQSYPDVSSFSVGIISMVNIKSWLQQVGKKEEQFCIQPELLDLFEEELKAKLQEVYSENYAFTHNEVSDYCIYCEI